MYLIGQSRTNKRINDSPPLNAIPLWQRVLISKPGRNFVGRSTVPKKSLSERVENQGSLVKFTQLGSSIKPLVTYSFLGMTKRELSMPAEVQVSSTTDVEQQVELHMCEKVRQTKSLQEDLPQKEQHTSRKRKNSQDKNTEPGVSVCNIVRYHFYFYVLFN